MLKCEVDDDSVYSSSSVIGEIHEIDCGLIIWLLSVAIRVGEPFCVIAR